MQLASGAVLRPWREADLESLVRFANNAKIAENLRDGFPHPYTVSDGEKFLKWAIGNQGVFAIDREGKAIGSIGYFPQSDVHRLAAEIAYWLAEPFWGQGIVREALVETAALIFRTTPIIRIYALPFGRNAASHKVLERAGFVREAVHKKAIVKRNEIDDEVVYVRIRGET